MTSITVQSNRMAIERRFAKFPAELKALDQWVLWRFEERQGSGKRTKVPYNPHTLGRALANDSSTWASFEIAIKSLAANPARFNGIGFEFLDARLVGVDLDNCRDPETGMLTPWARAIVQLLDSYTELSPSGTGLHIYVRGVLPGPFHVTPMEDGRVELYMMDRYFTVTGEHFAGTPLTVEDRDDQILEYYEELFSRKVNVMQPVKWGTPAFISNGLSDEDVLDIAKNASNGGTFLRLFNGDTNGYDNDDSRADLALCSLLAFYTQDHKQIDRLFRHSGLFRPKWDRKLGRTTYGAYTIERALKGLRQTYQPRSRRR